MGLNGKSDAFECTKCYKWFQISELATCSWSDDGSCGFHDIAFDGNPKLSREGFEGIKKQIQVIDDRLTSTEMKEFMKSNSNIKFLEP
jgi:hypothetical protein